MRAVDFRAVDFFAVDFLAVDFRAVDFFAVDFLAVDFFAVDFLAVDLRAVDFFAAVRFVVVRLAVDLRAVDLRAVVFFALPRFAVVFRPDDLRAVDFLAPARLRGTFAPFSRASDRPIAMACSRLVTRPPCPALPRFSVPVFRRRIALSTRLPAALPYRRPPDARFVAIVPPACGEACAGSVRRRAVARIRKAGARTPRAPAFRRRTRRNGRVVRSPRRYASASSASSAARSRGIIAAISCSDTAPTERRNHPVSSGSPNAWNGTIPIPAASSR